MVPSEIHSLHAGQEFSFTDDSPKFVVDDPEMIGYEGQPLLTYRAEDGLHACSRDHTRVWVE